MSNYSHERNILAMLAVPVLLSVLIGIPSDVYAEALQAEQENESVRQEDSDKLSPVEDFTHARGGKKIKSNLPSRAALQTQRAVESGDYAVFLDSVRGTPFEDVMTESAFQTLVHEYHLKKGFRHSFYYDS